MRQHHTEETTVPTNSSAARTEDQVTDESSASQTEDQTEATTRLIQDLRRAVRKRKSAFSWMPIPIVTGCVALVAVLDLMGVPIIGVSRVYQEMLAVFAVSDAWFVALLLSGANQLKRAVGALSETDDVRAVGAMAEALSTVEPALSIAGSVLIRLLPHLDREQFETLTVEQRKALRKGLKGASARWKYTQYNPSLATAILQAFERVGDTDDLEVVQRLAAIRGATTEQESIRTAAERCLAAIRARISGDTESRSASSDSRPWVGPKASLSPETVETLSTRLRSLARIRRRNVAVTASGAVVGTVLAFVSATGFSRAQGAGNFLMAGMLGSLAAMVYFALSGTYAQRNLTNSLIHSDDLQIVPPLIQAAATVEVSGTAAVMLLTRLLPRLRASDANLLDATDRILLNTAIAKHSRNTSFVLAALKALQQIGDAASIPVVQRLAAQTGLRALDPAVRSAAKECLEFLNVRAAQTEANQTLLRASGAAEAPTDMLLRVVDSAAPTASDELLRTTAAPITYLQDENQSRNDKVQQNVQAFTLQPEYQLGARSSC